MSVLSLLSKVLERVVSVQLSEYMDTLLSKLLCSFRKHTQFRMPSFFCNKVGKRNSGMIITILLDLPKAYHCTKIEVFH